jgi:hypothetical protein
MGESILDVIQLCNIRTAARRFLPVGIGIWKNRLFRPGIWILTIIYTIESYRYSIVGYLIRNLAFLEH